MARPSLVWFHRDLQVADNPVLIAAVKYGAVMQEYARQRGLTRLMIRVPVLTPRLSSLWLELVTPLYARVGRKIVDSACHATVDWWRGEAIEPNQRLRLVAEMKLPGRAWLEFEGTGNKKGSRIRQTAIFDPVGVSGLAYWHLVYPLHQLIFAGMLRGIARATLRQSEKLV